MAAMASFKPFESRFDGRAPADFVAGDLKTLGVARAAYEGMPVRRVDSRLNPITSNVGAAPGVLAVLPLSAVIEPRPGIFPEMYKKGALDRSLFQRTHAFESAERLQALHVVMPVRHHGADTRKRPL